MKQINLLDKTIPPHKVILFLAWPTIIEQILQTMVSYVDTAMVGSLGSSATASVAVTTSTLWLINGLMNAIAIGFSVNIARNIGSNNIDDAKDYTRQSVTAIFILGLITTIVMSIIASYLPYWLGADKSIIQDAITYLRIISSVYIFNYSVIICSNILRSSGDTKTPMIFNIMTNIINIVCNFLFIYESRTVEIFGKSIYVWGAGMGVSGAAMGTAIAVAFSGTALLCCIFFKKSPVKLNIRGNYFPKIDTAASVARIGTPVALERVTISLGQIALTTIVTGIGTDALAAHHLAITAEAITYLPVFGFSVAATTLVGQALGAREYKLADDFANICTKYGVICMSITGALMFIFSTQLMSFFTPNEDVIKLGSTVLKLEAFAEPCFALSIVISGILRAAGDVRWPFYISLIGMWPIRILTAIILVKVFNLGLVGAWIGMVLDLTVRGILCLRRFRSGEWKNVWR